MPLLAYIFLVTRIIDIRPSDIGQTKITILKLYHKTKNISKGQYKYIKLNLLIDINSYIINIINVLINILLPKGGGNGRSHTIFLLALVFSLKRPLTGTLKKGFSSP